MPQGAIHQPVQPNRAEELLNLKGIERSIDGFTKAVDRLPANAVQQVEASLAKASVAYHAGRYQGRFEGSCVCLPFGLLLGLLFNAVRATPKSPAALAALLLLLGDVLAGPPGGPGQDAQAVAQSVAQAKEPAVAAGRVDPVSGREVMIDLPAERHLRNRGGLSRRGPGTGSGLCVFTSAEMASDWSNFTPLIGLRDWMAANRPGGGWPEKVRDIFAERAPGWTHYVQATGNQSGIALMDWAMANGRMACVTYGAAHMVNLVHLDAADSPGPRAAILDNNRPWVFQWMSREEFLRRWRRSGSGWAFVLLEPPPPPVPESPKPQKEQAMYAAILCGIVPLLGDRLPADSFEAAAERDRRRASIVVYPPTHDAAIEVDGRPTESRGLERAFQTQPMGPGLHSHRLRVTWIEQGLFREWEDLVRFAAGDELHVQVPPATWPRPIEGDGPDDVPDLIPGGVVAARIRGDRLWVGPEEVTPRHFFGPTLPAADAGRPYVAIVGDEAFQQQARSFFRVAQAGPNARLSDRVTVGYFHPDSWHLRYDRPRAVLAPGVTVFASSAGQSPPLHHQADLERLDAALAEALRKVDPSFDAAAIPDLRKPAPGNAGGGPNWLAVAGGSIVLLLLGVALRR